MMSRFLVALLLGGLPVPASDADLILHNGKVITVDPAFRVVEAAAIKGGRITATGTSATILREERTTRTKVVDLAGKTVLPGLIDAHVHALEAGLSEFRTPLPALDSVVAIQDYIRAAARSRPKGAWIVVPRTLPPRLKEMRFPTKQDLDVTSDHPVAFDGSYVWGANSLALKISDHPGYAEPSGRRDRERSRRRTERHPSQCVAASQRHRAVRGVQ
jgi:predicted amidohydrolase YtcJ